MLYYKNMSNYIPLVFSRLAVENINYALISLSHLLDEKDFDKNIYSTINTYCFYHIQNILAACGKIYNIFYGYYLDSKSRIRRDIMQEVFQIYLNDYPHIFRKGRGVRNTEMHFDERLNYFNGEVGDYGVIRSSESYDSQSHQGYYDEIMTKPHLRVYDQSTGHYHTYINKGSRDNPNLCKEDYDFHKLKQELEDMKKKISSNPEFSRGWQESHDGDQLLSYKITL